MPTELEELLEFLHHGNTQIRQVATENLVPYSKKEPSIFRAGQLTPVKDLKVLVKDYAPIAKNALTILINISGDGEVLKLLAEDDTFLESLLLRITSPKEPNANELAMLLANMAKADSMSRLLTIKRSRVPGLSTSPLALDQLFDLFNKGTNLGYNPAATFDYLAYVFADLAKFPPVATHILTPDDSDPLPPLTKLLPFTTHPSTPRRLGLSSLLKNLALGLPTASMTLLFDPPTSILPCLLLPLCGPDPPFTETEMEKLLPELQFLGEDQKRESDNRILRNHLETLFLIGTRGGDAGNEQVTDAGTYYIIRELHVDVDDEDVREGCERIVHILMGEENADDGKKADAEEGDHSREKENGRMIMQAREDEDDNIVEIF